MFATRLAPVRAVRTWIQSRLVAGGKNSRPQTVAYDPYAAQRLNWQVEQSAQAQGERWL